MYCGPREKPARCSRHREVPSEKVRPLRLVVNQRVLAERNQAVAPVGAWVESAHNQWQEEGQSLAVVSAFYVEEEIKKQQREKQEHLLRFQHEVRHRVNQHARMRKRQQLLKSYNAAEKEGFVVQQSSDSAGHVTPKKKNTCVYRNNNTELAIRSPRWVPAQQIGSNITEDLNEENTESTSAFQQQAIKLGKTLKQVKPQLAACKTVQDDDVMSEMPGGIWKVSPTKDNLVSRRSPLCLPEDHDEYLLEGHHDLPAELHSQTLTKWPAGKENGVHFEKETGKVYDRFLKDPYPEGPAPVPAFSTDFRASLVLRPGVDLEENKKQRENKYLMYRRRLMEIEREQVKEMRRQKEHEIKVAKMKKERELHRNAEEQRICRLSKMQEPCLGEREERMLAQLKLEDQRCKLAEKKKQKSKEHVRYVDALRAQMMEKLQLHSVELPPLCCCGSDFWDAHPDTCANNCVFYRNPKAYAKALQSVIASCNINDGSAITKSSARAIASARAHSLKSV